MSKRPGRSEKPAAPDRTPATVGPAGWLGPRPARGAAGRWVGAPPLAPSRYPAPAARPVATCLPPLSPPGLGGLGLCRRSQRGPPSTDARVTPLIAPLPAPSPGAASIFHGILQTSRKPKVDWGVGSNCPGSDQESEQPLQAARTSTGTTGTAPAILLRAVARVCSGHLGLSEPAGPDHQGPKGPGLGSSW